MLILCSNGLCSPKLIAKTNEYIRASKTAALVVTADHIYKEQNHHVPRCVKELESLSLEVTLFDLDQRAPQTLLDYDVVEFIGGNPYYLLHSIRRSNAAGILQKIAVEKLLIGWSAAAFVFGPTLELVDKYSSEMNFWGLIDLSGLALTEIQILPHYSKFFKRIESFEDICSRYEQVNHVSVIRLNDGEGIFICGQNAEICKE